MAVLTVALPLGGGSALNPGVARRSRPAARGNGQVRGLRPCYVTIGSQPADLGAYGYRRLLRSRDHEYRRGNRVRYPLTTWG